MPGRSIALSLRARLALSGSRKILNPSCRRSLSVAVPIFQDPLEYAQQVKFTELQDAISHGSSPARVWAQYTSLMNALEYNNLPLEVHQVVLRHCTPSSANVRRSAIRRLQAGNKPKNPHIHEDRFQTVISNIRAVGAQPDLDDYHFILEQFAATGHHVGAMRVYKELLFCGFTPKTKTFGLCLQAIAYRYNLPINMKDRPRLVVQTHKMLTDLLAGMRKYDVPFTSVNLDLTIRISKETMDHAVFDSMMKWGYGIDLVNPDRPPLEFTQSTPGPDVPKPLPFSTAALNTTIDILGRFGDISKLVQAFEVLTQPLPQATQHLFSSFDDDDDFGVQITLSSPALSPPHASPNTTTYNMLLRHICRAGHSTLARHYLVQAMELDKLTSQSLRRQIYYGKPIRSILSPHFSINRGLLLSVMGHSNRDKDLGLMRWLSTKMPKIVNRKRDDLLHYKLLRDRLRRAARRRVLKGEPANLYGPSEKPSRPPVNLETPILDLDLDNPFLPEPPVRHFDINLHIEILERDLLQVTEFAKHLQSVLGRTTQRVKERLGRRVWNGKDIFLSTEAKRVTVSKGKWQSIVRFMPRHNYRPDASVWRSRYGINAETLRPNGSQAFSAFARTGIMHTAVTNESGMSPVPDWNAVAAAFRRS